jgi:hypothetical protein
VEIFPWMSPLVHRPPYLTHQVESPSWTNLSRIYFTDHHYLKFLLFVSVQEILYVQKTRNHNVFQVTSSNGEPVSPVCRWRNWKREFELVLLQSPSTDAS